MPPESIHLSFEGASGALEVLLPGTTPLNLLEAGLTALGRSFVARIGGQTALPSRLNR